MDVPYFPIFLLFSYFPLYLDIVSRLNEKTCSIPCQIEIVNIGG